MRATLVIPALNEKDGIGVTLDAFKIAEKEANATLFSKDPVEWDVIVVDGNSTDGTQDIARGMGAKVIVEPRKGYGRAYRTGFEAATGDFIATMDADGTYPARELPWMLLRLVHTRRDFVTGNRLSFIEARAMTKEHRIGNYMLNTVLQVLFHTCMKGVPEQVLADSQSGMWVFRRSMLPSLHLTQDGMAFSEELKLEVMLRGFKLEEVPIHYTERWGPPKLSSWRDGIRNLTWLIHKRIEVSHETHRAERHAVASRTTHSP
jgi:hypothetical protein